MNIPKLNVASIVTPNIPGFRNNAHPSSARGSKGAARNSYFGLDKGYQTEGRSQTERLARSQAIAKRGEIMKEARARTAKNVIVTQQPAWLKYDGVVLNFQGYSQDSVFESREENYRVRTFQINYFPTDGTISITEDKQENSGIPQGDFVKRVQIPKPPNTKSERSSYTFTTTGNSLMGRSQPGRNKFYHAEDLSVGMDLNVYGRIFKVTDADTFTRNYYQKTYGVTLGNPLPTPKNKIDHMRMGQGVHDWAQQNKDRNGYFGREDNDVKRYMEAQRGREDRVHADAPGGTRRFLNNHGEILRFNLFWMDDKIYGDEKQFHLNLYLEDNTAEILYAGNRDGYDKFKALMKRSRIPMPETVELGARAWRGVNENPNRYIEPADLRVGKTIEILKRKMFIYDCTTSTYAFYENKFGEDMRKNRVSLTELKRPRKPLAKNTPPEYWLKGISTEEETLETWKKLRPRPLKRDEQKLVTYEGKILKYKAVFAKPKYVPDKSREFIICYYLADDSIRVFEVPQLNTGIIGGKFANRAKRRNPDTGKYFTTDDLDIGKTITINTFEFILQSCDQFTSDYKSGSYTLHKTMGVEEVERTLRDKVAKAAVNIRKSFRKADKDFSGYIDYDEFRIMLQEMGIYMTDVDLITLMRKYDGDGQGEISYAEFCHAMIPKDYVEKGKSAHSAYHDSNHDSTSFDADEAAKYLEHMNKQTADREKGRRLNQLLNEFATAFFAKGKESDARKAFKNFDVDNSGYIDRYEFSCALKAGVGVSVTESDIILLEDTFYGDDIEELSYTTFIDFIREHYNKLGQTSVAR